jgi:hypothetical protein
VDRVSSNKNFMAHSVGDAKLKGVWRQISGTMCLPTKLAELAGRHGRNRDEEDKPCKSVRHRVYVY